MSFGLKENTIHKIQSVFTDYPEVTKAILYGSRAKGTHQNGSDIDLTLHGNEQLTLKVIYKIMNRLDDLFLPYTIDLSIFNNISDLDLIEHIRRVGVLFYEKDTKISLL